ncbi:hypothetical protein [Serratia sp. (in: enterobacteria)]|uniref:hypothetical protein n=1 Tax=Serratia sp. (in: enterobacteria) TaxID=616 RepID=UPI003988BC2F
MSNPCHQAVTRLGFIARLIATCLLLLSVVLATPLQAETITIGKGSGIVWEGKPFDVTLSGPMGSDSMRVEFGLASISTIRDRCMKESDLVNIAGYLTYQLAPGVGLIPRATVSASYQRYVSQAKETLSGTIGLPETKASANGWSISNPVDARQWCLPPRMSSEQFFYLPEGERISRGVGSWAIVADGTQTASEIAISPLYYASFSSRASGDRVAQIFSSDITLRVSTLECSVQTTANIDFGAVSYSKTVGAELGKQSYPLVVSCGQASDYISANINLQLRALSGLYNGQKTRLALTQGGGYITGEIENGTTGSGACNLTTGLPFDNSPIKIGSISNKESSKSISDRLTWRLCSGGSSLPVGKVTASAEMMVTFN